MAVTGLVSLVEVAVGAVGVVGLYGTAVPSPVLGCGDAWPMPCAVGVCVLLLGGWVMAGGWFW